MFCWYVRNTYLENNLREPGKTVQCGEPVDLSQIDIPAFLYASRETTSFPGKRLMRRRSFSCGRDDVRAGRERTHRRRDQSGGEEQAQPLDRRQSQGETRTPGCRHRDKRARQLVAGLERSGSPPARETRWRRPQGAGQQKVQADRAGAGASCDGQGELTRRCNQLMRGSQWKTRCHRCRGPDGSRQVRRRAGQDAGGGPGRACHQGAAGAAASRPTRSAK